MKKILISAAIAGTFIVSASAQQTACVETKTMESKFFPFEREIFVYTPANYAESTESEFDVIYVFDSQYRSRFDLVHSLMHYGCQPEGEDGISYIVVGIPSPYHKEFRYHRNRDFLPIPEHLTTYPDGYCNSENFKHFIKDEVMPYIKDNYRTTGHTLAIGHSLAASFILDSLATDDLFNDYIAFSPNFEWDENRFGNEFINYDFNNGIPRYIHLTMANESEETGWGPDWRTAWDNVKDHFETTVLPAGIKMTITEYPQYSHNESYQPALIDALNEYARYSHTLACDTALYPVHLEVTAEIPDGCVYVTGNQPALADWNPAGILMDKIADNTYAIDLKLTLPAEFKFTQGSWESELMIRNAMPGNLRITEPTKANKHYKAD